MTKSANIKLSLKYTKIEIDTGSHYKDHRLKTLEATLVNCSNYFIPTINSIESNEIHTGSTNTNEKSRNGFSRCAYSFQFVCTISDKPMPLNRFGKEET